MLSLDARQPVVSPSTQWEDLSELYEPFTEVGDPTITNTFISEVYQFNDTATRDWFMDDAANETNF